MKRILIFTILFFIISSAYAQNTFSAKNTFNDTVVVGKLKISGVLGGFTGVRLLGSSSDSITRKIILGTGLSFAHDTLNSSYAITADNGLTASTSTNVQLGGTLTKNTILSALGFQLTHYSNFTDGSINGSYIFYDTLNTSSLTVGLIGKATGTNASSVGVYGGHTDVGIGVEGSALSGIGVYGTVTTGTGVKGNATSGKGVYGIATTGIAGEFQITTSSTNSIVETERLTAFSTGTAAAGLGAKQSWYIKSTDGATYEAGGISYKWIDATTATRTSQLIITGVNSGSTNDILTLDGDGTATFIGSVHINNSGSLYLQTTNSFSGNIGSLSQPIINSGSSNRVDAVNMGAYTYVTVSSAGTLALTTNSCYIFSGTTTTWTLPAITSNTGVSLVLKNRGSGNITLNSNAGGNDIYDTSAASTMTVTPGQAVRIVNDGTYWSVISKY